MREHENSATGIVSCLHCGNKFNALFTECPFCGMKRPEEETTLDEQPSCPRCHIPLRLSVIRDLEIDICPQCRGIWLDSEEFDYLTSERDVYSDPSVPRTFEKRPLKLDDESIYLPCLRCGQPMHRRNFKKVSGILIDLCPKHGAWLDAGELEQIRSFVANVDAHRSLARQDELLQEEVASLTRQLRDVELVQQAVNIWNLKYWLYRTR